jgi:hypothetical protein
MAERRSARARMAPVFAVFRWLYFAVITIALVAIIPTAIMDLAGYSSAGVPGTATVTHCDTQAYQTCYGDFTSSDGRTVITNAALTDGREESVGTTASAYGDAATRTISVTLSGPITGYDIVLPIVLVLMWIPLFWLCIWRPIKRRVLRHRQRTARGAA